MGKTKLAETRKDYILAMGKEVKAYNVDVEFWNTVIDEIDMVNYTVFAKNVSEVEEKVKADCGETFIKVWEISVTGGVPLS